MHNKLITHARVVPKTLWTILIALAVVIATYWSGLYGGFFFDDHPNILQVEGIRLSSISSESIKQAMASGTTGVLGRPVSQLSFAINYFLHGPDPFAFKITNLVIHCLNAVLVFFIALQLISSTLKDQFPTRARIFSGIVGFAWAIHPIQITSVLYVVQRMTSLSAMFLLIAFFLHIHARQSRSFGYRPMLSLALAWMVFWPLSLFSKESGILFPGFVAAYELIIRRYSHQGLDSAGRALFLLVLVSLALSPLLFYSPVIGAYLAGYEYRSFTLTERLLTENRVIWEYLGMITVPRMEVFGLFHDDIELSSSLLSPPTTLLAVIGLAGLLGVAWKTRTQAPLVSFGIVWFLVGHSLESTFLPLEIAHEHRNYLPLLGICLLPIHAINHLSSGNGVKRTVCFTLCFAFLGYLSLITALRANMFGNDGLRTQLETHYHPDSARSNYEAGRFLSRSLDTDAGNQIAYSLARKHYELATNLDPAFKLGLLGVLHLDCSTKKHPEAFVLDELKKRLEKTPFAPGDATLVFSIQEMTTSNKLCLSRSDIDDIFAAALSNPRISANVKMLLNSWHADYLWLHARDMYSAKDALNRALAFSPSNPSNRLKMAQLFYISGERDHALQWLLELRGERLQQDEKKTLSDLLTALGAN